MHHWHDSVPGHNQQWPCQTLAPQFPNSCRRCLQSWQILQALKHNAGGLRLLRSNVSTTRIQPHQNIFRPSWSRSKSQDLDACDWMPHFPWYDRSGSRLPVQVGFPPPPARLWDPPSVAPVSGGSAATAAWWAAVAGAAPRTAPPGSRPWRRLRRPRGRPRNTSRTADVGGSLHEPCGPCSPADALQN